MVPRAVGSILGVRNTGRGIPQELPQQGRREVRLELCWELGSPKGNPPLHAAAGTKGGWEQELAELPALAEPGWEGETSPCNRRVLTAPCWGCWIRLWNHPCDKGAESNPASGTIPVQQARARSPRMGCRIQTGTEGI